MRGRSRCRSLVLQHVLLTGVLESFKNLPITRLYSVRLALGAYNDSRHGFGRFSWHDPARFLGLRVSCCLADSLQSSQVVLDFITLVSCSPGLSHSTADAPNVLQAACTSSDSACVRKGTEFLWHSCNFVFSRPKRAAFLLLGSSCWKLSLLELTWEAG